jgi:Bacterial Ig domain
MTTKQIITLAAAGALAALSTVAISASTWLGASAVDAGTVHLHLGTDSQRFTYGSTVQNITVAKNSCAINSPGAQPLINLASSASGGRSAPGLANYGLGVKESPSSGNGNPCAQIAGSEVLTITPGSQLAGHNFRQVRFDLEMTGDAVAVVTLSRGTQTQTYRLQTGHSITSDQTAEPGYDQQAPYEVSSGPGDETDACAAPNSSGPNSAGNDNCQWTITPGFDFNTIAMSSLIGTATIEGGGDFPAGTDHDTLFVLGGTAPVANDDSAEVDRNDVTTSPKNSVLVDVLNNDTDADNDSLTVAGVASAPAHGTAAVESNKIRYTPADGFVGVDSFTYRASDGLFDSNAATVTVRVCSGTTEVLAAGDVTANFTRLTELDACKSNTVAIDVDASTVLFQPEGDNVNVIADYRGFISFGPKDIVLGPDGAIELLLKYDASGGTNFVPVPWCDNPQFNGDGEVTTADMPTVDDSWCIASESTVGQGTDSVVTTWQVFGQDDPRFV